MKGMFSTQPPIGSSAAVDLRPSRNKSLCLAACGRQNERRLGRGGRLNGGLLLPGDTVGGLEVVVRWLQSGALGEALRQALTGDGVPLLPWLVLVGWGAVLSLAVVRFFRWRD